MSIELKIKSKHLALEPAIIRREEKKLKKQLSWYKKTYQVTDISEHKESYKIHSKWYDLHHHRKTVVRNEARSTHLARAFLAGLDYKQVEAKRHDEELYQHTILPRIIEMVAKYGPKEHRIYKYYGKDGRTSYKPEEYEPLKAKILEWSNLD